MQQVQLTMKWFGWYRSRKKWQLPQGMKHFATHGEMGGDRVHRLEEMAFRHGIYFDSYVATEPNREYLWSSDDRAVIGFVRVGRFLHVAGGILAEERHKARMLSEIVEFARLNGLTVSFFHIESRDAALFRWFSFQVTRFGVESRLPLAGHNWQGKDYVWVRRQANYVTRQGVRFEEWRRDATPNGEWDARFAELREISEEFIGSKIQKGEVPFFEGRLLQDHLYRRRIFVARSEEGRGRVEGFVVCNPMSGGREWAIEMYRQRADAVRGVVPFLFHQTIDQLKQEGCDEVSICPIPTIGCERKLCGDNAVVRFALNMWRRFGYAVFDVNGIYHFKSRFRPELRDMFVCAYPRSGLGATLAYMKLVGVFRLKLGTLFKKIVRWAPQRRTLARPQLAPEPEAVGISASAAESAAPAYAGGGSGVLLRSAK